jgi:hypothetical protein
MSETTACNELKPKTVHDLSSDISVEAYLLKSGIEMLNEIVCNVTPSESQQGEQEQLRYDLDSYDLDRLFFIVRGLQSIQEKISEASEAQMQTAKPEAAVS